MVKNKISDCVALIKMLQTQWGWRACGVAALVFIFSRFKFAHSFLNKIETLVWSESSVGRPYGYSLKNAVQLEEVEGRLEQIQDIKKAENPQNQIVWDSLIDKRFFARHLPPQVRTFGDEQSVDHANNMLDVKALYQRPFSSNGSELMAEGRGNLLFMSFAQWLTDGVLRSSFDDRRKTDSSHQIDLAQIYGGSAEETLLLRERSGGRLKLDEKGNIPKMFSGVETGFSGMSYYGKELDVVLAKVSSSQNEIDESRVDIDAYKNSLRATGLKTGTLTVGNLMISTLFAREHNRSCAKLIEADPDLTDEQIFQFARNITIVRALQIILKDYIGFITGKSHYKLDQSLATKLSSLGGWIPIEFNLLYRWHSAAPSRLKVDDNTHLDWQTGVTEFDNYGLEKLIKVSMRNNCGDIKLNNTPTFLMAAEENMIQMARDWKIRTYADYCRAFNMPVFKSFLSITGDKVLADKLSEIYGEDEVEKLEFVVGIFAEKKFSNCLFGRLLMRMVAYDAFNHIYSNPLLAPNNFTAEAFSVEGLEMLNRSFSLDDLIKQNTSLQAEDTEFSFYQHDDEHTRTCDFEYDNSAATDSQIQQTLCPVLRVGEHSGELKLDSNGWIATSELKRYMTGIGFKKGALITTLIVSLAKLATNKNGPPDSVQVTGFRGSFQDHGSSSRIQHGYTRIDEERLNDLLGKISSDGYFSRKELAQATLMFHRNATENGGKPSLPGAIFQLLEMGSVLRIFGKTRVGEKGYFLGKAELLALWKYSKYPKNFCPATQQRKPYGTVEAVGTLFLMMCHFSRAWVKHKWGR